jgi:hypothetical protein
MPKWGQEIQYRPEGNWLNLDERSRDRVFIEGAESAIA